MNNFRSLYFADISRYPEKPEFYIRTFLYLYRRVTTTSVYPLKLFYIALFRIWSNRRGLEISPIDQIGGGLYLGHAFNITINPEAKIGKNCNIHKGVLIGQVNRGIRKGTPIIGNQVWIGVNAAIVGNIKIGDDVLIAPNSFVNVDVPSHSVVFGNPCVIKPRNYATEGYVNRITEFQ